MNQLPYALVSREVEMWQLFPELLIFSNVCRFSGKKKKKGRKLLVGQGHASYSLFSVIQECCYISENKQPCSVEALTRNISFSWQLCLESASPSGCHQLSCALWLLRQSAVQLLHSCNSLLSVPPDSLTLSSHAAQCKTRYVIQFSLFRARW